MTPAGSHTTTRVFTATTGYVVAYSPERQVYTLQLPDLPDKALIECPMLATGMDAPCDIGTRVAVNFFPGYGWVILGRLPTPLGSRPLAPRKLEDSIPLDAELMTFRPSLSNDAVFWAQPGTVVQELGSTRSIISRAGAMAWRVAATCARYMTQTASTIKDLCETYILSLPNFTLRAETVKDTQSPTLGQPQVRAEIKPEAPTSRMSMRVGGGVIDDAQDGVALVLGELVRLLLTLDAGNPQLTYTHGPNQTLTCTVQEFLLQFTDAAFRLNGTQLQLTKGTTIVTLNAGQLQLTAVDANLSLQGLLEISAVNATLVASGEVTMAASIVRMQEYIWLTLIRKFNALAVQYLAHTHPVPGVGTTGPTTQVVDPLFGPVGPIAPNEV